MATYLHKKFKGGGKEQNNKNDQSDKYKENN
jgi:hypothetical protein